jgi:Arc/MetJ family transcription regulator
VPEGQPSPPPAGGRKKKKGTPNVRRRTPVGGRTSSFPCRGRKKAGKGGASGIYNYGIYVYALLMTKRLVDIDDDLLERARRTLGTGTMKETVNRALEEAAAAELRRRHAERLASGDGTDLGREDTMAEAWR